MINFLFNLTSILWSCNILDVLIHFIHSALIL